MFKSHKLLAVIPARKGSKGLPGKNMLPCAGKPLSEWTMDAALGSKYLDKTVVSTDWKELGALAASKGLKVRDRPEALATDFAQLLWVIKDAWSDTYDLCVLLQPTSPTRTAGDIDKAIEHYFSQRQTDLDTLASVTEVPKAGWLMDLGTQTRTGKGGYATFCFRPKPNRQGLTPYYKPNGAIYILTKPFEFYRRTIPYVMPHGVDIDTAEDLAEAEELLTGSCAMA